MVAPDSEADEENSQTNSLKNADPKFHGAAEGELEPASRNLEPASTDLELMSVGSGRIKLRRGIAMDSGAARNVGQENGA